MRKGFSSRSQALFLRYRPLTSVSVRFPQPILCKCAILPGFWEYWEYWEYWECAGKEKGLRKGFSLRTQTRKKYSALRTLSNPSAPSSPDNLWRGHQSHRLCRKSSGGAAEQSPVGLIHMATPFSIHRDEGDAEAGVAVPVRRTVAAPIRRTAVPRAAAPTAPA